MAKGKKSKELSKEKMNKAKGGLGLNIPGTRPPLGAN